ncbi:PREDICTED: rho GTPase-activating protein REN1-like isoform X3 [Ipomoea nil]|uniref:rho GTPase-activating protein REN1-like isoform X3 n=1 Tax=Ipomoea nil TaxID=35883 RepID=UPI00090167B0|nr:PREDICTED: rho GTPase-activating protein REN1-like isoform X3 [Ipomoea nil]
MPIRNADASQFQGEGGFPLPPVGNDNQAQQCRGGNKVYKTGPMFISSKVGIGWTTWKKRWFILTRTSLVFFRSDPTVAPKKGGEVNLTLGGIDLNSSGSVVVKEDKKLLTILFPDGRDGRAFTLKAETLEDLLEWKAALEEALANAPNAALVMGQNGMFRNDQGNALDASDQSKDRLPVKSLVIGRPILLALEDIDGTASFLEKALRFVEEYGVRVEGILRQAADVDDVERRIQEYEQGKREFSPDEDAHVIADCVKYILRELPSSPVPASCCKALLEAHRTAAGLRVNAMHNAILETFPEPNRRLLQRILTMMQKVASHKNENRMGISAVAACMAPLLLRPLLSGECELEPNFDMGDDGSVLLLRAAAAANHAQAIVITLLEEYTNLFREGSVSPELYSDSDGTDDEELSNDESYNDDVGSDAGFDDDSGHASTVATSETGENEGANKVSRGSNSSFESLEVNKNVSKGLPQISVQHEGTDCALNHSSHMSTMPANESRDLLGEPAEASTSQRSVDVSNAPGHTVRRPAVRVRARGINLPLESIDFNIEEDPEIQRLEATKIDLENKIAEEAKGNTLLKESLAKRKNALHERRLALQQDVARLQEQFQKERELRMVLEAELKNSQRPLAISSSIDESTKTELEEIAQGETDVSNLKQRADDLGTQLNKQREQISKVHTDTGSQPQQTHQGKPRDKNRDADTHPTSQAQEKPVRSKHDTSLNKADGDRDKKNESQSSVNKQSKQSDPMRNPNTSGALIVFEPNAARAAASSRKSGSRTEGANPSSALSKLTNRLNFLKERRTQLANELLNSEKSLNSCQTGGIPEKKGSDPIHSSQNMSENQSSEKNKGSESLQAAYATDGQSVQNPDRGKR